MQTRSKTRVDAHVRALCTKEWDTIEFGNMVHDVFFHMNSNPNYVPPTLENERAAVAFFANALRHLKRTMIDHGSRWDLVRRILHDDWNSRAGDAFFSVWWSFRDALSIYGDPDDLKSLGVDLHRIRMKYPVRRDPTMYPITVFACFYAGQYRRTKVCLEEWSRMTDNEKTVTKWVMKNVDVRVEELKDVLSHE